MYKKSKKNNKNKQANTNTQAQIINTNDIKEQQQTDYLGTNDNK